jgi:hypothetical protein
VLDSGCSHFVSGLKTDFVAISEKPDVKVRVANEQVVDGFSGELKRNRLKAKRGVFCPELGARALVGCYELLNNGMCVFLSKNESFVGKRLENGNLQQVCKVFWDGRMPVLDDSLFVVGSEVDQYNGSLVCVPCDDVRGTQDKRSSKSNHESAVVGFAGIETGLESENVSGEGTQNLLENSGKNPSLSAMKENARGVTQKSDIQAAECSPFALSFGEKDGEEAHVDIDNDVIFCPSVLRGKSKKEKERIHQRLGHLALDGVNDLKCTACVLGKASKVGHKCVRDPKYEMKDFLDCVDWDFKGPISPESYFGELWLLNCIDQVTKWAESYPCASKEQCFKKLEEFVERIGVPKMCRSDNAPEFKGLKSNWRRVLREHKITPMFSAPYHPQMNGMVERFNRTIITAIRAMLVGVDIKLWSHAAKYFCYIWNRLDRKGGKKSPFFGRYGRDASLKHLRRFGCVCFPMLNTNKLAKESVVSPRRETGVFLGWNDENSCALVGVWRKDGKLKVADKLKFQVEEVYDVAYDEDILISDITDLKRKGTFVPFTASMLKPKGMLGDTTRISCAGTDQSSCAETTSGSPGSKTAGAENVSGVDKGGVSTNLKRGKGVLNQPPSTDSTSSENADEGKRRARNKTARRKAEKAAPPKKSVKKPPPKAVRVEDKRAKAKKAKGKKVVAPKGKESSNATRRSKRVVSTKAPVVKQKRGSKVRANFVELAKPEPSSKLAEDVTAAYLEMIDARMAHIELQEEFETAELFTVQVSRKEAMTGPDSTKWLEADSLERAQLEALKCWRPLQDGELQPGDEIIPSVVLYTKKRCGRFKARIVALGNRQKAFGQAECYSPVISHAGNRFVLTECAARGDHEEQFDISNAFIKSDLDDQKVIVRLPKHWSSDSKGDLVRLLKSLYGLRISPRNWFETMRKFLEGDGWVMCPREPGLFRKERMLLTVYVDDCLLVGPCKNQCVAERDRILHKFPGKVIEPTFEDNGRVKVRDILGATWRYSPSKRWAKFSVEGAIDRCLEKFGMEQVKPAATPCYSTSSEKANLAKDDEISEEKFPIRSLVGSLQYISNTCRPDVSFACQVVARQVAKPTVATVKRAKRIMAYLKGTKLQGCEYSPEIERKFRSTYGKICDRAKQTLPDTVSFSDADFMGCSVTMKSTSGSIMYHRGCPIVWSSKRQSLKATSTCESEYVALYDTIKFSQSQGYLDWFVEDGSLPLIFCDNQSALNLSKSSLVTKKSKHMNLRYHIVRDFARDLCYCPTDVNRADPLTKPLVGGKYVSMFLASSVHLGDVASVLWADVNDWDDEDSGEFVTGFVAECDWSDGLKKRCAERCSKFCGGDKRCDNWEKREWRDLRAWRTLCCSGP